MSTIFPKKDGIKTQSYLVDAKGKTLGRLAARVAYYLRGKEKLNYTPNVNMGNFMVVVNAKDIVVKGTKIEKEFYATHSNYPSGLKITSMRRMFEKNPAQVFFLAVKGMMPKTSLGNNMLEKLRVYADDQHPHSGQKLIPLDI